MISTPIKVLFQLSRGTNVTLDCQYSSNPIQRLYKWEHNRDVIFENSTNDHYTVTANSLTIHDITPNDAGLYKCNVTNQCGSDGVTFVLDVIGKSIVSYSIDLSTNSLPYSGKLSREKTFANFADLSPFVKFFFANIACPYLVYSMNQ